jgi:hypothetical protein
MSEESYSRMTYDITTAAAQTLVRLNLSMTFIYVSGGGTDSSEKGSTMWARVKGRTENALLRLPFKAAYMFRPTAIQPLHGIKSKTCKLSHWLRPRHVDFSVVEIALPQLRHHYRASRPGHAPRGTARFCKTNSRSTRHQSGLGPHWCFVALGLPRLTRALPSLEASCILGLVWVV